LFSEIAAAQIGLKDKLSLTVDSFLNQVVQEDRIVMEYYLKTPPEPGEVIESSFRMIKLDSDANNVLSFKTRFTNVSDSHDRKNYIIGTLFNITKQEKYDKELTRLKEKAEELNMRKNIFLANISHEIRTPMNSIIGFSELLNIGILHEAKRKEYVKIIIKQGQQLQKLVDDISELTKYETGELNINKSPCNLNILMNELLVNFNQEKTRLNKINLEIKTKLPDNEEVITYTDSGRITQILSNLINTSIYFTDKGYVEFGYNKTGDSKLEFFVKDTGVGFTPDEQKYMFDRLSLVDDTIIKKFEGLGLSLTISNGLVKLLGGKLWVESETGEGSAFYFQIPYEEIPFEVISESTVDEQEMIEYNWKNKVILIVEDDEVNFKFLEAVLQNAQAQILQATNGAQAVELCRSISKIDLILMDLKLPKMNGFEATKQIRKFNKTIPIIAQTALVLESEREKCFQAGCTDQITKPIEIAKLVNMINKYLTE
jgi:signal transduction histidine kinase/ActR/RegA family two-component response regulator